LALDPRNPIIEAQLAALLCRFDSHFPDPIRRQEIRQLTAKAIGGAPDHPMPWVALAKLMLLEGNPREAEQAALKAVEQGPDFDRGYTTLGEALISQGRLDAGLDEIRHSVDLDQGYLRARLVYAFNLQEAGRSEMAAAVICKALEYDPDHPTANQLLGEIYLAGRRNLAALSLFRKVFEATRDSRAANGLGLAYLNLELMPEAIQTFHEAYRLQSDPITARNLADCYEQVGQEDEAQRWYALALEGFDRLLIQGGSRTYLLYLRSFCAAKLGRIDEAFENIQDAMRLKRRLPIRVYSRELLARLADSDFEDCGSADPPAKLVKLGRIDEALGRLKPDQSHFLFRMAQIHAIASHRDEVYTYTMQAIAEGCPREEFRDDFVFRSFQNDRMFQKIVR
jgi:tetratricopeptide (TPR) repeat protein